MLLVAPATYVAAVLFLLLMGFLYLFLLEDFSRVPQDSLPSTAFFSVFWLPVFFMVPLLTMKSIAEERNSGTLETLMTTSASPFEVVLSKFLGAYCFYCFLWGVTISFPLIVHATLPASSIDPRLLDMASWTGGYLFVALSGVLYIALGIFCSSLTRSQLVAGMLSFSLLFMIIIGGRLLAELPLLEISSFQFLNEPIKTLQVFSQLEDFSRGIIDSRPFFLYISSGFLFLGLTSLWVEAKA
tara:strand:+ start:11078 stop:11803 length:726 start_codon:yes stop_codon:yes gene_type:complete